MQGTSQQSSTRPRALGAAPSVGGLAANFEAHAARAARQVSSFLPPMSRTISVQRRPSEPRSSPGPGSRCSGRFVGFLSRRGGCGSGRTSPCRAMWKGKGQFCTVSALQLQLTHTLPCGA